MSDNEYKLINLEKELKLFTDEFLSNFDKLSQQEADYRVKEILSLNKRVNKLRNEVQKEKSKHD